MSEKRNQYIVTVLTESGCDISEGEYDIRITEIIYGDVGEDDFELVSECIAEVVEDLNLAEEGLATLILHETGEFQDVFWVRYYEIYAVLNKFKFSEVAA